VTSPTLLGVVGAVNGASVSIRQHQGAASGVAIIGGRSYRVGQVGGFVRIPQGYHDLYGIITDAGATATPETETNALARGERWIKVQLAGEVAGTTFERGVSQFPSINDEVHVVVEDDLRRVYGSGSPGQVQIGHLSGADSVPVLVDLNRLVTRHSAVLGSTGSGKSTTVASIIRSISEHEDGGAPLKSARILLIDIHGEYANGLRDVAKIFAIEPTGDQSPLYVPFWALDVRELLDQTMGALDERALTVILDRIRNLKTSYATTQKMDGVDADIIHANSPIPFSIRSLWYDLYFHEHVTWQDETEETPAFKDGICGDVNSLVKPVFLPPGASKNPPHLPKIKATLAIKRQVENLWHKLLDPQYRFLMHPGEWEPDKAGATTLDLSDLLSIWLGHEKAVTILDLSGVPSNVLSPLIGGILSIVYEGLFWGRMTPAGGRERPLLVVLEEAHRYLGRENSGIARDMVQRIVKEGRKFGIGGMIVSQRPSEIDETILSQCGTFFALRISNSSDRSRVQAVMSDNLGGIVDTLPMLRTGEAVVVGEAAKLPVRCRIRLPKEDHRPSSDDPRVSELWARERQVEDYGRVVAAWRSQRPDWPEGSDHD
jgi:uncharacterized protein